MIATPATSRRLGLLCGLLGLALLLLPAGAYLCTEEPPAIRKKEGACLVTRLGSLDDFKALIEMPTPRHEHTTR